MGTQTLHYSLKKYQVPLGLYTIEESDSKADLLNKFSAAGISIVSIKSLRVMMGVPAYTKRLEVALVSIVNGLLAADYPVIFSDEPYVVEEVESWFTGDVRDIGEVGVW